VIILMAICLLSSPGECREERISLSYETTSPMACVVHSQSAIAVWQASHPLWRVGRWRCVARGSVPTEL
jgi:hypothetical protein